MFLLELNPRLASLIRLAGLGAVWWSVVASEHGPGSSGRGLVVAVLLVIASLAWIIWVAESGPSFKLAEASRDRRVMAAALYVMAVAGGLLTGADPHSAASVFVFAAVVVAGLRAGFERALPVLVAGSLGLALGLVIYDRHGLALLAYIPGFAAALLAASNRRQALVRAEEAELLLAQTQRSREEQLRAARLEESARIAREIHDVLAHSLVALVIQLEATGALVERGAERASILSRIDRARALAREGLEETRQAVGALRGETDSVPDTIRALAEDYGAAAGARVEVAIDGDTSRVRGPIGRAVLRVAQEAFTNVRKHAPDADLSVALHAGEAPEEEIVLIVADEPRQAPPPDGEGTGLERSRGGYGLRGMRERAEILGGTLEAGAEAGGWRVELRLPSPQAPGGAQASGAAGANGPVGATSTIGGGLSEGARDWGSGR
jgi:signal transduction histidine kinase